MSLNAIDHSGAGGSGSSSFTQGDSILHRRRLSQVAATLQPVSDEEAAVQRALLSQVQSRSTSFRGFSENELDLLFPYLNIVEFQNGDPIMKTGEEASWTGIVLGGELEASLYTGAVIGRVMPGTVVGEMALFRGGKRGCDMRAVNSGAIAVLRFSEFERIESIALQHKLMIAFGREAYLHSVHPQQSPFMRISKQEGYTGETSRDRTNAQQHMPRIATAHTRVPFIYFQYTQGCLNLPPSSQRPSRCRKRAGTQRSSSRYSASSR